MLKFNFKEDRKEFLIKGKGFAYEQSKSLKANTTR